MDPVIITVIFALGYSAYRLGLPPLVGFLVSGFVLHGLGYTTNPTLSTVAEVGVTLLLFTIGLKLNVRSLLRPEIWAGATFHMVMSVSCFAFIIFCLSHLGLKFFLDLDLQTTLLIAFGLSFSSTVFAVKILEESGVMNSLTGNTAIGVLIIQDIIAVVYLTLSSGKTPSLWAILVIALLPVARKVFLIIMDKVGHSEIQVLFGLFLALSAGAASFDLVGLKADLGALILGMIVAPHPRASELANSLITVKDILLVGFFVEIGLSGFPAAPGIVASIVLLMILPVKMLLYFLVFTRFRLRSRTSFIATMKLSNYSEFGLIVCSLAAANEQIDSQWLVVLAIALSVSFILASPCNRFADVIFTKIEQFLTQFETVIPHPEETPIKQEARSIVVIGMGRVGVGAYDRFYEKFGDVILGIDMDHDTVSEQQQKGRYVRQLDVTDPAVWRRLPAPHETLKLIVLAIPNLDAKLFAVEKIRERSPNVEIVAIAQYDDEVQALHDAGVRSSFNLYGEAGHGLATHACDILDLDIKSGRQIF